jgi:hypothetical protein
MSADVWAPLRSLLGNWEGEASGHPGKGRQERRYELILRGRFLMGTNKTLWEPTGGNPEGEVHEDITLFSFDRRANRFHMRAFYVEGFFSDYEGREIADDGTRFVFVAEAVENGPIGMRARETLRLRGADRLSSTFEIAMPGKDFAIYTEETLRRY